MKATELREALNAEPFRPFRVHLSTPEFGGRMIEIAHPELVVVSSTGRTAIAYRPNSDAWDVMDIVHIDSLEFPDPKRSPSKRRAS
ncbi:MAG: hypothetical protein ACTS3F_07675 [Phycisphaerales bacterium]